MGYSTTGVANPKNEVETNHLLFKNTMKNENPEEHSPLGPTLMDLQGLKVGFSWYENILLVTLLFWGA
uniref:Uncharacterized protein n=1 Tax=Trichogramma kaykai TaxID=54128 RepID=A0ABD2WVH8_9HYME